MDQNYLLAAARYIELNPVRAALARAPGDWPWSSTRAHLAGADNDLVRVRPLLELAPDWRELLHGGLTEEDLERLRRHTRAGRPLGAQNFVVWLENRLGRLLAPQKTGRKSSTAGGQFAK
jgi:putative transposase